MRHRSSSAVLALLLCLILAACGEAVATRSLADPPTPTPTNTPVRPTATTIPPTATATQAPRATSTAQPTSTATRPRATVAPTRTAAPTRTPIPRPSPPAGVVAIPDMGASHVNEGQPLVHPHSPPSSGTHYPSSTPRRHLSAGGQSRQLDSQPGTWLRRRARQVQRGLRRDLHPVGYDLCHAPARSSFGNVKFIATTL